MKVKAGVNLHNRFDIVKNGEWVGYAENIILDQMYDRICNFSSYFNNIHFGTGSGTPTPDRTSLFSHLGTKTAETEEVVKALPTSKVTKKIVLMPEEYVGQTITEVGVAYGSTASYLVTHAMIKDAEGNPLSIDKTDIDVIEIYATIFVTLIDSNEVLFLNESALSITRHRSNVLLEYLISGETDQNPTIMLESHNREHRTPYISTIAKKEPSISVDSTNKTRTYSVRFGIDEANYGASIYSVSLEGICRKVLNITHTLSGHNIGVGDGVQDTFEIPHSIVNPVIKVNGYVNTDNVVTVFDEPNYRISPMLFAEELVPGNFSNLWAEPYASLSVTRFTYYELGGWKNTRSLRGKTFTMQMQGGWSNDTSYLYFETSEDGSNWTTRLTLSGRSGHGLQEGQILVDWDDLYYRLRTASYGISVGRLWIEPDESKLSKVVFNTPPAIDDVITIDGTLPYYPKDENYVVDVTFELQFGEGV